MLQRVRGCDGDTLSVGTGKASARVHADRLMFPDLSATVIARKKKRKKKEKRSARQREIDISSLSDSSRAVPATGAKLSRKKEQGKARKRDGI